MRRDMSRVSDVMSNFKAKQQLMKEGMNDLQKKPTRGFEASRSKRKTMTQTNHYDSYLYKLDNGKLEDFNTRDIMYFFRDTANENGVKYVIANFRVDMSAFKMCISKGHTPKDILVMIEFLFTSNQDYLKVNNITPNIFRSGWVNKIYQDSLLWLDDEYVNEKTSKFKKREWTETVNEENATIDEWGF